MRLVHVVPSLEERHGGPSKSARALANALARRTPTELLATLEAGQRVAPAAGDAAQIRIFPREAPRWLCRSPQLAAHLAANPCDLVHEHSLWLLTLRYARSAARAHHAPLVISPRGMMTAWAWQHRRWRKFLADWFVHPGALHGAAGWHATSDDEADDIRRLGFCQPICVAPNGVELPTESDLATSRSAWLAEFPQLAQRRIALFYSRFHRKKRLRELVDLWRSLAPRDWTLLVAGVPEEYSADEVSSWCGDDSASIIVADGRDRPPPFALADLFVLPSHSENFGLVIAEALAAGVPALVTDGTPWQGLGTHDAGACVAWDEFPARLGEFLATPRNELLARGARGRTWMERDFTWQAAADKLLDFYRSLKS